MVHREWVYHFAQTLGAADNKQVIPFPFDVPPGCGWLEITLRYAPERVAGIDNLLVPALFDPSGWRGTGHRGGSTKRVLIEASQATPGFLAGPLPAGTWRLEVEVHSVLPGEPCHLTLDIVAGETGTRSTGLLSLDVTGRFAGPSQDAPAPGVSPGGHQPATQPEAISWPASAPGVPGWYHGDLHTHTVHSDGHVDVAGRVRAAAHQGLDFFFLTDHNTVSGLIELAEPDVSPPCVGEGPGEMFGGLELTTFYGHALCLGVQAWIDWRVCPGDGGMPAIAHAAQQAGQLFIIAHPCSVDDPYCTGCAWHFDELRPGLVPAVEVWNGPWAGDSGNAENLALWYEWLNRGERVVATAGTDAHDAYDDLLGLAFDVVYAEELSQPALLDGIRRGHLYLSAGPRLSLNATHAASLTAEPEDREPAAMMGDRLGLAPGEPAAFSVRWENCPAGAELRVIVDGGLRFSRPAVGSGQHSWQLRAGEDGWCLVEVRDPAGWMLALTNPIYL